MKSFFTVAAIAAGASAAALNVPRATADQCCFGLNVNGGYQNGSLGQLDDGQNRVGPGFSGANYCLSSGTIYDSKGYACVIAMPQTQFQCDLNGTPTPGFAVTSAGLLAYNGNTTFYECAATANMQFNIYTTPYESYCAPITLSTTGNTCSSANTTCSTVTNTVTQTAISTVTASIVSTLPAQTITVAGVGQTVTETQTVAGAGSTVTVTAAAQTIEQTETVSGSVSTVTVTISGARTTGTDFVTQTTQKTVMQTTTVTETAPTETVTVTQTAPGTTVTEITTITGTTTQTQLQTTVQSATETQTTVQSPSTSILTVATTQYTTTTSPSTTTTASATSCPPNLNGTYQYPHLIIPVNSESPDTAYGTQYFGYINSENSTIFTFDIPSSYSGSTCSLIFLLPLKSQLETSNYTLSGSGTIEVLQLDSGVSTSTTYNTVPEVEEDLGAFSLTAGSSMVIATTACAAGETVSYEIKSNGDYSLTFFEDWNPSPLGLFVRAC